MWYSVIIPIPGLYVRRAAKRRRVCAGWRSLLTAYSFGARSWDGSMAQQARGGVVAIKARARRGATTARRRRTVLARLAQQLWRCGWRRANNDGDWAWRRCSGVTAAKHYIMPYLVAHIYAATPTCRLAFRSIAAWLRATHSRAIFFISRSCTGNRRIIRHMPALHHHLPLSYARICRIWPWRADGSAPHT